MSKKKIIKIAATLLIGIAISALGYFLQLQKFNSFPPPGDTFDELKGAFNGVSLIKTGIPRSWSWFEEYGVFPIIHVRNVDLRIVEPYFDDPPLFALISGYYAISKGMDSLEKIDAAALRWPMLKVEAFNIFLLFILVSLLKGLTEGSLAALIYATIPTMVLGARLSISDNGIVTSVLISLLSYTLYIRKNWYPGLIIASVIAAAAFLMKSTGIFIPFVLIFLSLLQRKYKEILLISIFAIGSVGIWLWYGYHYNWTLFTKLVSIYSGRELYFPSMIINLFEVFRIGERAMSVDGWILWGWICIIIYSFLKKSNEDSLSRLVLPITVGLYLIFFSIMSGHSKGWYRFPFYPFLAWACASVFLEMVKNPRFLLTLFFFAIPVSSSYIYGSGENKWNQNQIRTYQVLLPILMAIPIFYEIFKHPKLKQICQMILILAFIVAIIFNISTIVNFQDQFWY